MIVKTVHNIYACHFESRPYLQKLCRKYVGEAKCGTYFLISGIPYKSNSQ